MKLEFDFSEWQSWAWYLQQALIFLLAGMGLMYLITSYIVPKTVYQDMENERLTDENKCLGEILKDYENIIESFGKKTKRKY